MILKEPHQMCIQINTHYPWVCDPESMGAPCVSTRVSPLRKLRNQIQSTYIYKKEKPKHYSSFLHQHNKL